MLAMLLLAGGDEPVDITFRLLGRFQVRQLLFRTIPAVGQDRFRSLPRLLLDGFHHRLQLLFVIGRFRHRLPDNQQHLWFHRRLRILALHKPVRALHDARLRVGEVVLILVLRPGPLGLCRALTFGRGFFSCSLLVDFLGQFDLGQARFPPPQLLRQLVAALAAMPTVFFLIRSLGLLQQLLHFFPNQDKHTVDAVVQLLDLIGQPVILVLNSGIAASGWVVADARSKLIKGIVAVEPVAPPIENAERGATGPGRVWGLTNLPVHYDPPIEQASELQTVREDKADAPDLIPCWVQKEPARKLVNLQAIPVLNVSGEASYHRPYAHCIAKWLNQAGVKTSFVNLEDVGLPGNGHQMMSERNSAGIAKYLQTWMEKNVR
jgi:hypothetical protein